MHTQPQTTSTLAGLRKYAPVFVVLASIGSFIGDVLQPLGPILFYTTVLSAAAAILLTIFRKRVSSRAHLAIGFLWVWFAGQFWTPTQLAPGIRHWPPFWWVSSIAMSCMAPRGTLPHDLSVGS